MRVVGKPEVIQLDEKVAISLKWSSLLIPDRGTSASWVFDTGGAAVEKHIAHDVSPLGSSGRMWPGRSGEQLILMSMVFPADHLRISTTPRINAGILT